MDAVWSGIYLATEVLSFQAMMLAGKMWAIYNRHAAATTSIIASPNRLIMYIIAMHKIVKIEYEYVVAL